MFYAFPWCAALNEALREEVQRLKIATGQITAVNGNPFNRGLAPQFPSHQITLWQPANSAAPPTAADAHAAVIHRWTDS